MISAQDGFIMAVVGLVLGLALGMTGISSEWRADTIERGLAQYCPLTGEWAWVGECDK